MTVWLDFSGNEHEVDQGKDEGAGSGVEPELQDNFLHGQSRHDHCTHTEVRRCPGEPTPPLCHNYSIVFRNSAQWWLCYIMYLMM